MSARCIAAFDDGHTLPFFDDDLSARDNDKLVDAVVAEGRRRVKSGRSDVIVVKTVEPAAQIGGA